MTAAVMPSYYYAPSGWRPVANNGVNYNNWMMAQMQYPAPSQPEQHPFNAMYPAAGGTQQLLDAQSHLQYGELGQVNYPRVEASSSGQPSSGHQVHDITHQLHSHSAYDDQTLSQPMPPVQPVMHVHQAGNAPPPHAPSQQDIPDHSQKVNRLRKACDSCSIRKVKCDESGPPCRACTALDIPCTFDRPSRRRGPPNRYAESIKKRRLEEPTEQPRRPSSPSSPTHAAHALAALSSGVSSQQLSAESICSIQSIDLLIDDFFTYIHPLCPFPHEPSFREAWKRREDTTNPAFLALLASMIGTLVASFPRKPRLDLTAQRKDKRIPDHLDLVNRCQRICSMARGPDYLENENLSVYDAATSYFLGLGRLYLHKLRPARLYFAQCLSIIRTLGLHRDDEHMSLLVDRLPESLDFQSFSTESSQDPSVDNITREMGRRVFWTLYTTIRSMQQVSQEFREVQFPPSTPTERYPPLPTEVDDYCIYPRHYEPQPPQYLPMMTGFNKNVNVFRSYDEITSIETALGGFALVDRQRQLTVLQDSLRRCKSCAVGLPTELEYNATSSDYQSALVNGDGAMAAGFPQPRFLQEGSSASMATAYYNNSTHRPESRRWIQNAIQKANIHASILSTRAYIVQKFWGLYEAHERLYPSKSVISLTDSVIASGLESLTSHEVSAPEMIEQEMREESGGIVRDVLNAVGSIRGVNMEANSEDFTSKIRALAGKLLEMPEEHGDSDFQEPLNAYLQSLGRLEQINSAETELEYHEDDESEHREWAELQACRLQLAELATSN